MDTNTALKVIPAYRGQADYIRAAQAAPEPDLASLWWAHAVAPFWEEWAAGQFNEARTREQMSRPVTDLAGLEREVELLAGSGIEGLVEREMERISQALPAPLAERAVCIYAADPQDGWVSWHGVVGTGIGDNILLQINPLNEGWSRLVPYVLAHEYHHAVWGFNYFVVLGQRRMDLLTGLLIDGQADSFAGQLYPQADPSWIHALTPQQEAEQWRRMQPFLGGNDQAVYRRFFFGDEASQTPGSTAYTIGYHIVQAYLGRHPGVGVADLMDVEAQEILEESGYQPGL